MIGTADDNSITKNILSGEKYQEKLSDEEKIDLIKQRRKELDSIRKWDFFTLRNNPEEALTYYLQVAERLPDDVIIQKKIWHAYYLKKDWENAYNAYVKTPIAELSESEQQEMLAALFFDESQFDRIWELSRLSTGTGKQDYYRIVDICYSGIHNCIVEIESYSWELQNIKKIQSAIDDAEKISPDYDYRNLVVANILYEYWEFRAVSILCREILQRRPDYSPVEKLLWFSLYEVGNYTESKKYLLSALERSPDDLEIIIRLGDIAFTQGDYSTANLYYNNVILAWYSTKIDIERKLAYSYSRLSDIQAMLKVLAYIMEDKEATADDAAVAISLALQNWENLKAYVWSNNSIKKYPDSINIVALYLMSMRTSGKFDDIERYLDSLPQEFLNSPLIQLESAIILLEQDGDMASALLAFEKVVQVDPAADFGIEAQNYIDFIRAKQLIQNPQQWDSNQAANWDDWWH